VLGLLGSSCVVMPTLLEHGAHQPNGNGQPYDNAAAAVVNAAIRDRADRVVEWDAAVTGAEAQLLTPDGIHPTAEGQALSAGLIRAAVDSCP
jgi:lysophospholipase L1-like esterase